jgi:hypothetical protein
MHPITPEEALEMQKNLINEFKDLLNQEKFKENRYVKQLLEYVEKLSIEKIG